MRVTPEHVTLIREAITPLDTEAARARYLARDIPRADAVQDLGKRYRWDLYAAAGGYRILPEHDYTDAHLDTALRAVVPAL